MSISVTCQACGSDFSVSDRHAGKRFACRNCRAPLTVPEVPQPELGLAELDEERPVPRPAAPRPAVQPPARAQSPAPQRPPPQSPSQAGTSQPPSSRSNGSETQRSAGSGQSASGQIEVACDGCGHRTSVGAELAGRRVRCKKCGQIFRVAPAVGTGANPAANPDLAAFAGSAPRPARPAAQPNVPSPAPPQPLRPPAAPRPRLAAAPPATQPSVASGPTHDLLDILEMVDERSQPALPPLGARLPQSRGLTLGPSRRRRTWSVNFMDNLGLLVGLVIALVAVIALGIVYTSYGSTGFRYALGPTIGIPHLICYILVLVRMAKYGNPGLAITCFLLTPCCLVGEIIAFLSSLANAERWRLGQLMHVWGLLILAMICLTAFNAVQGFQMAAEQAAEDGRTTSGTSGKAPGTADSRPPAIQSPSSSGGGFGSREANEAKGEDPFDTPASPRPPVAGKRPSQTKRDAALPVPPEEIVAQALNDLASGDHFERRDALGALKRLQPNVQRDEVAKVLVAEVEDTRSSLRTEAIGVLGVWGTAESVPALIHVLEDDHGWDAEHAMRALGKLKDPRGARAVGKMLETRNANLALSTLREMGPLAEEVALGYLPHKDARMRGEMCVLLEEIGTAKSLPELKKRFGDEVKEVRLAAKQAYATIETRGKAPPATTAKEPERDPFRVDSDPPKPNVEQDNNPAKKTDAPKALRPVPK